MGAQEKVEATFHPSAEYTPSTKNVRDCYVYADAGHDGSLRAPERVSGAEFDRWLAVHDRETRAEALEEAAEAFEGPDRFIRDTEVRRRLRDMAVNVNHGTSIKAAIAAAECAGCVQCGGHA